MDIDDLLNGAEPSFNDYAGFVGCCEKLPYDLLWKLRTQYPDLNEVLKSVVQNQLTLKIQDTVKASFQEDVLKHLVERIR